MTRDDSTVLADGAAARTRLTPRQGDFPQPASRHTPSALALMEKRRSDFWRGTSIAVCLVALALSYLTIRAGRATEKIFVMDPTGNIHAGPLEALSQSPRFFHVTAIYATNVALQRSPVGFDLFELLKLYYTPRAIAKLQDDHKAREPELRRRNLQWKPIIESIGDPVSAGAHRLVEVRGRLITAGAYANRSFYDESAFVLVLTLAKNTDLGKSGNYPWVCADFELKIVPAKHGTS